MRRKTETNTVAPDFDDDIIAEILLRLPANSLLRFRCVCKSWLALISAPSFVKNHLSRVNTKHFNLLVGTWPSQASVLKDDDGDIAITVLDYPITRSYEALKYMKIQPHCRSLHSKRGHGGPIQISIILRKVATAFFG